MSLLQIKDLAIGYEDILLKNISLQAENSELIAIVGANGSGKSTLMKTIAGILKKKSGSIFIKDSKTEKYTLSELAKIIGFSTVSNVFAANLTVYDVVRLGRTPYSSLLGNISEPDIIAINKAISKTGIEKIKNKEISKISDGQRQRAFIARLLAQETEILLFDEPTAFLDIEGKISISYLFREIVKTTKKTIIFSTHDLNLAIQYADKIWLFSNNYIFSASPEDLILNNNFSEIFKNSNLIFNNFTAEFYVTRNVAGKIKIINFSNDLRCLWTKKALERINFEIDERSDNCISVFDNFWQLIYKNNSFKINSIEQLQKILENDK